MQYTMNLIRYQVLRRFSLYLSMHRKVVINFKRFESNGKKDKADNGTLHLTIAIVNNNNQNMIFFFDYFLSPMNVFGYDISDIHVVEPVPGQWPIWKSLFLKRS